MYLTDVFSISSETPPLYILKPDRPSAEAVQSFSGQGLESSESGGRGSNYNLSGRAALVAAQVVQHNTILWIFVQLLCSLIGLLTQATFHFHRVSYGT